MLKNYRFWHAEDLKNPRTRTLRVLCASSFAAEHSKLRKVLKSMQFAIKMTKAQGDYSFTLILFFGVFFISLIALGYFSFRVAVEV